MSSYEGAIWDDARLIANFAEKLQFLPKQLDWFRRQPHNKQVAMGNALRAGGKSADDIVAENGGPEISDKGGSPQAS